MAHQQQSHYDYSGCRMGRAVARALDADSFVDDFDWHFVSQDGLAVKDAWEMATTWAPILQGHVTVRFHHDHYQPTPLHYNSDFSYYHTAPHFAIAPNYEWVEFRFGCCEKDRAKERAVAARASNLVWRALASCRGYGPQENALFWRRLFNQLQKNHETKLCRSMSVVDRIAMADDHKFFENVTFPRFILKLSQDRSPNESDRLAGLFVGLLDSDGSQQWSVETASQLKKVLATLAPLVQPDRPSVSCPMELALRFVMWKADESRINDLIDVIHAHQHQQPAAAESCQSERSLDAINVLVSQPYVVAYVAINDQLYESLMTCGRQLRTPLANKAIEWTSTATRANFRDFVRWTLRVNDVNDSDSATSAMRRGGGARNFQFRRLGDTYNLPAILSALRHTQCVETFQIISNHPYNYAICEIDTEILAWLGYALFHPDSALSTWRTLFLKMVSYRQRESDACSGHDALDMMAKGNNLPVALGLTDSETLTDAYYTATIRAGAVVHDEPNDDAEAVEILKMATQMDVCVTTTDVTMLNEWVFVVVIGYGKAWVRAGWIDQIVARPPGQPFLTGLKFDWCSFDNMELSNLLETAGGVLKYLDVNEYTCSVPLDAFVARITRACPQLESLTLPCRSGVFPNVPLPPRLRELWVRFNRHINHHELCLTSLTFTRMRELVTLRLDTMRPPTDSDVHEFIVPLLRGLPRLQRFIWNDEKTYDNDLKDLPLTYEMKRFITRDVLKGLQWGRDDFAVCEDVAPTATLVALDSVVKYYNQCDCGGASALGRLNKQLLVLIGGCLGTSRPRELWVTGGRIKKYT